MFIVYYSAMLLVYYSLMFILMSIIFSFLTVCRIKARRLFALLSARANCGHCLS
jgi:hypothetical protein